MRSPGPEDDEARVELLRTHEPMRAQMIRELLESEGIPTSTPGLEHRAMLGVAGGFVEIVALVPRRVLGRAGELVVSLDAAPVVGLEVDDDPRVEHATAGYRDPARVASTVHGKRRRIAVVASMILPGGAHLYVAEWRSAGIIALVELLALVSIGMGVPWVGAVLPLAVIADAIGGTWHCERLAGRAGSSWRRFAPELVALVLVGAGALMAGPGAAWAAGTRSTLLCGALVECAEGWERRECLWRAASEGWEARLPPSCEACLERASCPTLGHCDTCFE